MVNFGEVYLLQIVSINIFALNIDSIYVKKTTYTCNRDKEISNKLN